MGNHKLLSFICVELLLLVLSKSRVQSERFKKRPNFFHCLKNCNVVSLFSRRRPEKTTNLHMQLAGAMLCLHLSFLLSCFSAWLLNEDSPVCLVLGLILHWSLLATFSWTALEGFHLYLLLSRVFNITFRKYLLKLSLVGWGE